ncbi:hypothetical protein [Shimazuella soli]|uniref:hypothetical protein n=1 Tax=Shimazuella soli TaxID=1892854 RepID=UPI001F10968A|nr:hypothetical protein [Shimazuella soli]
MLGGTIDVLVIDAELFTEAPRTDPSSTGLFSVIEVAVVTLAAVVTLGTSLMLPELRPTGALLLDMSKAFPTKGRTGCPPIYSV